METIDLAPTLETQANDKPKRRSIRKKEVAPVSEDPMTTEKVANALTDIHETIDEHVEPIEPIEPIAPKAKAKRKPRSKSVVQQVEEVKPIMVDVETTTRKPKGHRLKKEDKEDLQQKVKCDDCEKTISLHNKKYTHKKVCKNKAEEPVVQNEPEPIQQYQPSIPIIPKSVPVTQKPITVRDSMVLKRTETSKRLSAQMF